MVLVPVDVLKVTAHLVEDGRRVEHGLPSNKRALVDALSPSIMHEMVEGEDNNDEVHRQDEEDIGTLRM